MRSRLNPLLREGDVLYEPLDSSAPAQIVRRVPSTRGYKDLIEWTICFAVVALLAVLCLRYVAEPVRVDGKSMLDTLQHNEFVLVTKYDYLNENPHFFDVVSCQYNQEGDSFVKRIAGLPGDMVELRAGDLYVNGTYIPQDFLTRRGTFDYGPVIVPDGCYFVLGDNRINSLDSRDPSVGFIPRAHILGHVRQVVFPFSDWRTVWDLR
ncbi:MAG: signal peptidase I [Oscillospiraceae bacterium]|nr:signal peptidase I [Oscillospiraceae bacterium]